MAENSVIGSWIGDVPADQIADVEDMCLDNMRIPRDKLSPRMQRVLEQTSEMAYETFDCKGTYIGVPVESIDDACVHLADGVDLSDPVLAKALAGSREVVAFVAVAHGFEALRDDPDSTSVEQMFFSGWGVGFSSGTEHWIENIVREKAHAAGLYSGKVWCPGENNVPMSMQRPLFELTRAEEVGVELQEGYTMRPVMSVGGFISISEDPSVEEQKTVLMV